MNCLFGGNSCTWVLILVIVFLLSQNCEGGYGTGVSRCTCGRENDCDYHGGNCGCNCGC